RHEFAAESLVRKNCDQKNDKRSYESEPAIAQNEVNKRLICPDQKSVYRIFLFWCDFPADEQCHQHRHKRHTEKRREEHRERFCEGERAEESAFLRGEREDRHEAHGDHKERKKERATDAFCSDDGHSRAADAACRRPWVFSLKLHAAWGPR